MTEHTHETKPAGDDGQLVDLVRAALVDPELTTTERMRLQQEIGDVLVKAHHELNGGTAAVHRGEPAVEGDHELQRLLERILVDVNLTTDLRMRLHHQIPHLVRTARADREATATR